MAQNFNDRIILSGVNMATSFVAAPICLIRNISFSFQATWTGTPTGIFTLGSSCYSAEDQVNDIPPPTAFDAIEGAVFSVSGFPGSFTFNWKNAQIGFNWVQFVYTATSGTGLLISLKFNGR